MIPPEVRRSLPTRMQALGISSADLARIANWSKAQLSGFLSGQREGDKDEVMNLHFIVEELERLKEIAHPFPINFSAIDTIQELRRKLKDLRASDTSSRRLADATLEVLVGRPLPGPNSTAEELAEFFKHLQSVNKSEPIVVDAGTF